MMTLLVYDISDDRVRTKVASACLDYGLDRIQFSAFSGNLSRNHQEALMGKIRRRVGKKPARIQLFTICSEDWARRIEIMIEEKSGEVWPGRLDADAGEDDEDEI